MKGRGGGGALAWDLLALVGTCLYLTRPRGKIFPRGQSAVPPHGLIVSWCIYSRFSIFCLNVDLMFPQILRPTQLDTPCLQQSRKKKTRYDCLFFEKKDYKTRAQTFSQDKHCCDTMQTGATLQARCQVFFVGGGGGWCVPQEPGLNMLMLELYAMQVPKIHRAE